MVRHDLICSECGTVVLDQFVDPDHFRDRLCCPECGKRRLDIVYLPAHSRNAACHTSEACVVLYSPEENKYQYPGRNDAPVPDRLKRRGYEKVEMRSIHDIERFEKQHHVVNERVWYDKGSGRGYEDDRK